MTTLREAEPGRGGWQRLQEYSPRSARPLTPPPSPEGAGRRGRGRGAGERDPTGSKLPPHKPSEEWDGLSRKPTRSEHPTPARALGGPPGEDPGPSLYRQGRGPNRSMRTAPPAHHGAWLAQAAGVSGPCPCRGRGLLAAVDDSLQVPAHHLPGSPGNRRMVVLSARH